MSRSFVSPSKYVQAAGALDRLGPHAARLGTEALLLADDVVFDVIGDTVSESFEGEVPYHVARFRGDCTEREIDRLAHVASERDVDVVVGAGGGKAVDVAKAVRGRVGGALVSLPTVASTDAPTSGLSVVYDADGRVVDGIVHDRRPELVLVDTDVVAAAPTRWFVSGIGDALATRFEAAATVASGGWTFAGGDPTQAGVALAEQCYDVIRTHGPAAVDAVTESTVTDAVEATTEAIVLLSGLGFENGGLAAAHAIHDGITATVDTDATHGEKVCFGLLVQLVLEGRPDAEIRDVAEFASDLGLPVTLRGVGASRRHTGDIARAACGHNTTMSNQPGTPGPETVEESLDGADDVGRSIS